MSNDEKIVELLKNGIAPDFDGALPKHIITAISNVFIFKDKAYKIYKRDNDFFNKSFNDLSKKENRFIFTRKDFEWNNRLSPEVYTKLRGVVLKDGAIVFTESTEDSDELIIEMNKIDMSNQLMKRLIENRISLDDCLEIGRQFGERISHLPKLKATRTTYEDFLTRYQDLISWVGSVKNIPLDKAEKYLNFIKDFIESHKDELNSKDLMGVCVDVHADNAVLTGKSFSLIDTYAPKEAWLHGYKFINIYRLATDIYAFLGKEYFEKVLQGYEETTHQKLPRKYDKFLVIYCELVTWPYQYMLSEKEPERLYVARKYQSFIEKIFQEA
jgi:aminoglycoside phosphotransferase family enzyme